MSLRRWLAIFVALTVAIAAAAPLTGALAAEGTVVLNEQDGEQGGEQGGGEPGGPGQPGGPDEGDEQGEGDEGDEQGGAPALEVAEEIQVAANADKFTVTFRARHSEPLAYLEIDHNLGKYGDVPDKELQLPEFKLYPNKDNPWSPAGMDDEQADKRRQDAVGFGMDAAYEVDVDPDDDAFAVHVWTVTFGGAAFRQIKDLAAQYAGGAFKIYSLVKDAHGRQSGSMMDGSYETTIVTFSEEQDGDRPGDGGKGGADQADDESGQPEVRRKGSDRGSRGRPATLTDIWGHWAYSDIEYLAARGIVQGMRDGVFEPDSPVTRAQFIALIVRALNLAGAGQAGAAFNDVPAGHWAFDVVGVAVARGLIQGVGDGALDPDRQITRQEMAAILARALHVAGRGYVSGDAAALAEYDDRDAVAGWAVEAVASVKNAGLMRGRGDGRFEPLGIATRAEAATVVKRLMDYLGIK